MATIAEIATTDDRFNILVAALTFIDGEIEDANLVATIADPDSDLTVFAPTDAAFTQLALDLGFDGDATDEDAVTGFLATTLGAETLLDVVLYHLSAGAKTLAVLNGDETVSTLNGATITSDGPVLIDNEPDLLDPSIVDADIEADNGIIQGIDRVLLPVDLDGNDAPTIAGIVAASGDGFDNDGSDFDALLAALSAAGLVETFAGEGDFTVFAPNDAAFLTLAQTIGYDGTDEAEAFGVIVDALTLLGGGDPIPLLTQILTYHVATESLQSSQVIANGMVTTLEGGDIEVAGTSLVDLDPGIVDPNLIALDIQASNGIVHVIDGVLLPLALTEIVTGTTDLEIGSDNADFIFTSIGDDLIDANDGFDFVIAGAGDDTVYGGGGRDTIFGSAGDDTLIAGEGEDVVYAFLGADTIVATVGTGRDVVFGFRADRDTLDVADFGITAFDDLNIDQSFSDTRVDFGNGDVITLIDVTAADLDADDFVFAPADASDTLL